MLTAHDVLPREPRAGPGRRAAPAAARASTRSSSTPPTAATGSSPRPASTPAASTSSRTARSPTSPTSPTRCRCRPSWRAVELPVVLLFGLVRPYKGLDVLLEAWRGGRRRRAVGRRAAAHGPRAAARAAAPRTCASSSASCPTPSSPAFFDRADLVVLPYREIDQSGVLFTALAFGKPLVLTRRGRLPRGRREGAAELVPPGDPAALARRAEPAAGRPGRARAPRRRGPGGRDRPLQLGRRRPTPPAPLWHARSREGADRRVLGSGGRARVRPGRLPAGCSPALARLRPAGRRPPPLAPPGAPSAPHVALVVAAHAEEDVIAAEGRQRPRAGLARRPAEFVVACDGSPDARPRRARAAGADLVLELPRGGKVRAAGRRRRRHATRRCWPSRTRTRLWEPDALRALVGRARAGRRRLRLRQRGFAAPVRASGRHEPGGPVLALRDGDPRPGVGAGLGHRRQRRDLRRAAGGLRRASTRSWGTTSSFPFTLVQRGLAGGLRARGAGHGEDGPHGRGRVARASGG